MPLEDIVSLLRAKPFVPFLVHLLDGSSYEVPHPERLLPLTRSVIITQNPNPQMPYGESGSAIFASLLAIGRLQVLDQVPGKGNGQSGQG